MLYIRNAIKIFLFVLFANSVSAQQVGMYAHYFFKPMFYNPAFTGNGDGTNAMLINRTQWAGIKGSPQLNIFTLDGNLTNKKAGLGLTLISDRKGITKRMGGNVSYSYKLEFNETTFLSLGMSLGVIDHSIDFSKAYIEDPTDPTLFFNLERRTAVDANAGFAFTWKGLQLGFAVPQLIGNKINYVENTDARTYYMHSRHFMGSLRYKFMVSQEKEISVTPQMLMRLVPGAPFQFDGNLNFEWKNKFWLGAAYKSNYAIGINAGLQIHKQVSIGYSYDVITGSIGRFSGISHEIMLNFRFEKNNKSEAPPVEQNKRMDSLTTAVQEMQQKADLKEQETVANQKRIDSLAKQLETSNSKMKQLEEKVAQQSKVQNEMATVTNQNKNIVEQSTNKVMEDNTWVVTNSANDFKDIKNNMPKKGFYVIAGTFFYRDFAMEEARRFVARGFKGANWVYSAAKQYNYVYLYRVNTKEEAIEKAKAAKSAGISDAWIQVLTQ
jgi:type IX secretion system PorP/SprF family membrane protein